jgi:succinate dehydrogenase/fumarate reductase flavoprotein subunit
MPETLSCDVLIVGSGAAGLSAALAAAERGRRVTIIETSSQIGGSTAYSEGMIWVPLNAEAQGAGLDDSVDAAVDYLVASGEGCAHAANARAYAENAAPILADLMTKTDLRFTLNRKSIDYFPDLPGATRGRRALNPGVFDATQLGKADLALIRPPLESMMLLGGMSLAASDVADYYALLKSPRSFLRVAGWFVQYVAQRAAGWPRGTRIANGNGIVGAFLLALRRHGVEILTDAKLVELHRAGARITGALIERNGGRQAVVARCGVVLASGGFSMHEGLTRKYIQHVNQDIEHLSFGPGGADGAGGVLEIAKTVGAAIKSDLTQPALWAPASRVPLGNGRTSLWPHFSDRAKPGVIMVDAWGRRFMNEATAYHYFVPKLVEHLAKTNRREAWLIADHTAVRKYGFGAVGPSPMPLRPYLKSGYLIPASTPSALAERIGVDPVTLAETIAAHNADAARGHDSAFAKGASDYDKSYGDPDNQPNACLRPLEGMLYAIRLLPGDIGTFAGVATDDRARVLADGGAPVDGLFAAGNVAASLMGGSYPAAGLTIGSAIVFGTLAGRTI